MSENWSVEYESNLAEYEVRKEYEEWLASVDAEIPLERAPEDFIRESEENAPDYTVEQIQEMADEWEKYWSRFDFPYEFE